VEITWNTNGVAQAARSTTEAAERTHESARSLSQIAAELKQLVGQFKYQQKRPQISLHAVAGD
jgi:methyl-accepting chemotaxis protein